MNTFLDNELIKKFLEKNDKKSLHVLIKKYLDYVYNFIHIYIKSEEECEDITQETFLKVWKNIKKFDLDKNFKVWLFKIAKNTALDYLKKKKNINFSDLNIKDQNEIELIIEEQRDKIKELDDKNNINIVKEYIEKLPFKYRQIINLYYFSDFNLREISELLGESQNTVKSKHRRAINILKKQINESINI